MAIMHPPVRCVLCDEVIPRIYTPRHPENPLYGDETRLDHAEHAKVCLKKQKAEKETANAD